MKMKILLLLFAAFVMTACQKEEMPQPTPAETTTKAAGKCDPNCTECRFVNGQCDCLFCKCTRYCKTCSNQTYPINRCVCGTGGGDGGSEPSHEPCLVCRNYPCVCNKNTSYPIEHMDKNMFSSEGGAGSQQAAFRVRANYRSTGPSGWPGHDERGQYVIYDGNRFDRSASNLARYSIDDRLKRLKVPVVAKIRCIPEDLDHMYYGLEYYIVITGTGGPETYYTYMDLKIENSSFLDIACDTQNNRLLFEGSDKPLRDPHGTYGGSPYIVIEVF